MEKNEKQRVYFVIDMKTFFASVECAERNLDPFETNLVVADPIRGKGGVCLAVTPKLKSLGVRNRCRLYEIPNDIEYIIAKPRMKKYIDYAAEIYGIYLKYIDKNDIHVYSIDECFIDATDYLKLYHIRAKDFALKLTNEIYEKLKIPSSVGIGTNMYLAKIALDITAKHVPDRVGWLTEEKYKNILWTHEPITDFWQISKGTMTRLKNIGITNMMGIAKCDENLLYKVFGVNAELLIDHAWGRESCTIADIKKYKTKSKSIGHSQILPKNYDYDSAKLVLTEMVQSGCYELMEHHYVTDFVDIHIGFALDKKDDAKGSVRFNITTNLFNQINDRVQKLFEKIVSRDKMIRQIGITFCNLQEEKYERYDFFTDIEKVNKEKRLTSSIIELQKKFGRNSVLKGFDLKQNATQIERNKLIGGHNSGEDKDEQSW